MKLDQRQYAQALARRRNAAGLELTTAFQTRTAIGGPFAGTDSAARRRSSSLSRRNKATAHQPGGAAFKEEQHPRDVTGKFIEKGDTGGEVKAAQGLLGVKQDGRFGKATVKAVRRYQRENGLQVDGVIGQQTAASLLGNGNADSISPGALRPGQYRRLVKTSSTRSSSSSSSSNDEVSSKKPIASPAEDSLSPERTKKLAKAGWDYHSGKWWPPGHPKNKKD